MFEHVIEGCQCKGKKCGKCEEVKCVGAFHRRKDSFHSQCKICRCETEKGYRSEPEKHEQILARRRERYHSDPEYREGVLTQQAIYRNDPAKHEQKLIRDRVYRNRPGMREYLNAKQRAYYRRPGIKEHYRVYGREYMRAYRQHNLEYREREKTYDKLYRSRPDIRERRRVYWMGYSAREQTQERIKSYRSRSDIRDRYRIHTRNRHARRRLAYGTFTPDQIKEQLKRQHYRCYYAACGFSKFPRDAQSAYGYRFDIEHMVPLSRIEYAPRNDMSNIVLACEHCNSMKHSKLPHEWYEGGRLL
jgi:5-methylcytosine-specific restriction endonuclease McrA